MVEIQIAPDASTKGRILYMALSMFYERGYDKVSTREIAESVGIKVASIYNHFESKEKILEALYDFYIAECKKAMPDTDELMRLAETEPPHEVLMRWNYRVDPSVQKTVDMIIALAIREMHFNPMTETFVRTNMVGGLNWIRPLLERMMECKRIEPINIDAFLCVLAGFTFYAIAMSGKSLEIGMDNWNAGLEMIFSLVKPLGGA